MPENTKTIPTAEEPWFVVTVKPQHELSAAAALESKGIEKLAPTYVTRRRWTDRVKKLTLPLFPGYVFCRGPVQARGSILCTPGVRGFVSFGRGPEPVPQNEISAILRLASSGQPLEPQAYLRTGERVRVVDGPLRGLQGTLIECEGRARVAVGIEMLQRSVSVEIDRAVLEPLTPITAFIK